MAVERPRTATCITQHTLWTATSGENPPLAVPPTPIPHAVLDSRDVTAGDLFVALAGQSTDGHNYIGAALANGAQAVIAEERGRASARQAGAAIVDCTRGRWALTASLPAGYYPGQPLAYIVDDSIAALQRVGAFQRVHRAHPVLRVIGVTGSVGKTSTKELTASVMRQRFQTLASQGNLNNEQGLPLTLLSLNPGIEVAVLEMGMYDLGEIERLCTLARPQVGIVTMVGPVHLSRLGTIERIAQAKAELVQALPPAQCRRRGNPQLGRPAREGDGRVDRSARLSLRHDAGSRPLGRRSGKRGYGRCSLPLSLPGARPEEGRVVGDPGPTCWAATASIRRSVPRRPGWWKAWAGTRLWRGCSRCRANCALSWRLASTAPRSSTTPTMPAQPAPSLHSTCWRTSIPKDSGRRIAVLGDMRELGSYTREGHQLVGRRAADVVDVLVTVGELGAAIAIEAKAARLDPAQVHDMPGPEATVALLRSLIQPDDLVLVKGSRAIGMESIVTEIVLGEASSNHETGDAAGTAAKHTQREAA